MKTLGETIEELERDLHTSQQRLERAAYWLVQTRDLLLAAGIGWERMERLEAFLEALGYPEGSDRARFMLENCEPGTGF